MLLLHDDGSWTFFWRVFHLQVVYEKLFYQQQLYSVVDVLDYCGTVNGSRLMLFLKVVYIFEGSSRSRPEYTTGSGRVSLVGTTRTLYLNE